MPPFEEFPKYLAVAGVWMDSFETPLFGNAKKPSCSLNSPKCTLGRSESCFWSGFLDHSGLAVFKTLHGCGCCKPIDLDLAPSWTNQHQRTGATCLIADWTDEGLERSLNAPKRRDEVLLLDQRAQKEWLLLNDALKTSREYKIGRVRPLCWWTGIVIFGLRICQALWAERLEPNSF